MAEREVAVEFVFERTGESSLAQAYRVLVPERRARLGPQRRLDDSSERRPPQRAHPIEPPMIGSPAAGSAETSMCSAPESAGRGFPAAREAGAWGGVDVAARRSS